MVERHRIRWHEKKLGQLFCDRSAQDILTMLEEECVRVGVRVKLSTQVKEVRKYARTKWSQAIHRRPASMSSAATRWWWQPADFQFQRWGNALRLRFGGTVRAEDCGAASGAGGLHPESCGHQAILRSSGDCDRGGGPHRPAKFPEKLPITHYGFSGPAILQISSYWKPERPSRWIWHRRSRCLDICLVPSAARRGRSRGGFA